MKRKKFISACVLAMVFLAFSAVLVSAEETVKIQSAAMYRNGVPTTSIQSGDEVTVQVDILPALGWVTGKVYLVSSENAMSQFPVAILEFAPGITSLTTPPFVIENTTITFEALHVVVEGWANYEVGADGICEHHYFREIHCDCEKVSIKLKDELTIPISVSGYTPFPPYIYMPPALWVITGARYVNEPFALQMLASGTGTMVWQLETGKLPKGLTMNETGLISGTPTEHGVFMFTASVESEYGRAEQNFNLVIVETKFDYDDFPKITNIDNVSIFRDGEETVEINNGDTITVQVYVTDIEGELTGFNGRIFLRGHSEETEIMGMDFNQREMSFISEPFTIDIDWQYAELVVEIRAMDKVYESFSFSINMQNSPNKAPVIITEQTPWMDNLKLYGYYGFNMKALGAGNITWTLVDGELPGYMTLCTSGLISGTPTETGMFPFTVKAENEYGEDYKEFYLIVINNEVKPKIGTFNLTTGEGTGLGWDFDPVNNVLTVLNGADVTIMGTATNGRRIVTDGYANITLNDVNLQGMADGQSPLLAGAGTGLNEDSLNLIINGVNNLQGGSGAAGIQVPANVCINIVGQGTLLANGGLGAAGIGGGQDSDGGIINIYGDVHVNATGGAYGAGIGGGTNGNGGTISIHGKANVTAIGGINGAGIGGGQNGDGGTINIYDRAEAVAMGGVGTGAGIGGGSGGASGLIFIDDFAKVSALTGGFGKSIGAGGGGSIGNSIYIGSNTTVSVNAVGDIDFVYIEPEITPIVLNLIEGEINDYVTVTVTSLIDNPLSYQWYAGADNSNTANPISGAIYDTLAIPRNLTQGDYYYFLGVYDINDLGIKVYSDVIKVSVKSDDRPVEPVKPDGASIYVSTHQAVVGDKVTVEIKIANNPGFATMPLRISYPSGLKLVGYDIDASLLEGFSGPHGTTPGQPIADAISNHVFMNWVRTSNYNNDGTLLTMTFAVDQSAELGKFPISIDFMDIYSIDNPMDKNGTILNFSIINGYVEILGFILGDVSGNNSLDLFDATLIARHLAGHTNLHLLPGVTNLNLEAGMVTPGSVDRGHVRLIDAVMIARFLAGHEIVLGEYPEN